MRPIHGTAHPAMLHRIEMNVIYVPRQVSFIANLMFPIPPLPYAAFAFCGTAGAQAFPLLQSPRESCFKQRPSFWIVRVPAGIRHMACRWSGNTTIATIENGCAVFTLLITSRRSAICRTNVSALRSARFTVKKYVPPATAARR